MLYIHAKKIDDDGNERGAAVKIRRFERAEFVQSLVQLAERFQT